MPAWIIRILDANNRIIGIRLIRAPSLDEAQRYANESVEQNETAEVNPSGVNMSREGNLEARVAQIQREGWFGANVVRADDLRTGGTVSTISGTGGMVGEAKKPDARELEPERDPQPTFSESPGARVMDFFSEAQLPIAAFQRGLQDAGLNPEGTFRNALAGLYGQASAATRVGGLFDPAQQGISPEEQERHFQNAVAAMTGGGRTGVRTSAANAYDRVISALGAASEGEGGFDDTPGGNFLQSLTSGVGALGAAGGATAQDLRNTQIATDLARAAAARKYSPFVAQSMLASDRQIHDRFARGGTQGGFFEDVRRQLGVL